MKITLRIKRFNPEQDDAPRFEDFDVQAKPADRILDLLMFVQRNIDPGLGLRKSCAHGVCGSDAMVINGSSRLACKTLVQDVAQEEGAVVTVEPLRSFPVQRDLMVDYGEFFDAYRSVKPFLVPAGKAGEKENIQSPEEREKFDDSTKCILCASCWSACPVEADESKNFIGPAASVQAARFVFDSRDKGLEPRMGVLGAPDGVEACENHFECTRACPRGIKVTKNINLTKREIKKREETGQ